MLEQVKPTCQESLNNNFNLDEYTRVRLKHLFNETSEYVLMKALSKYQAKLLKHKEKMI